MTRKSTINRTLQLMLTVCGVWPTTSGIAICRAYWFIALGIDEVCHCRYFLLHLQSNDLFDLMDCFSSFLAQVKVSTKLFIFWWNQRKFMRMLTMMAEDWDDCANSDFAMRETTCKARLSSRITNAMFTLHVLTIVAYSAGILLADVDFTDQRAELPLLLKVNLPVDINTKRRYRLLLSAQFVHLIMAGCSAGLLNALLLALSLHVGGQMEVLRSWLIELVPKEGIRRERRDSIVSTTNKIIRKHQRIINFTEYIEDLYTYIALVQFTSNTVLMCSLGFLIVSAIGSPDATEQIVRSLLFYTVTNLEAFIFCFAGEYLKNKSTAIGTAAYNSTWYELGPENSRPLIFVILRAQKQLTLTVGKIMDLSLESFTNIMKASGSYLSVLLAMQ
ncbi:odorant receptor 4-like [Odontomachus brunneus]|uniref:odorant receptor 4-like n=1 Tax=Odontomachus brunneus TaxID=486640 RepID=UPI0013F277D7|nr:odorant receptor 4-like [Odontomachus brunneus]